MRERRQAWYPTFLSWMNKMEDGEGGDCFSLKRFHSPMGLQI